MYAMVERSATITVTFQQCSTPTSLDAGALDHHQTNLLQAALQTLESVVVLQQCLAQLF